MRQPTTVSALQSMEKLGLVTLERETEDRRKLKIHLTAHGRSLKAKLLPDIVSLNDDVALKGFSERDIVQFRRFLNEMYANLSDHEAVTREPPAPSGRSRRGS
jgi:DNA-binding MarR family transcriptional regulator